MRIFQSGFEFGPSGTDWTTLMDTPTIDATAARSGTYGLRIHNLTFATRKGAFFRGQFTASTTTHWYSRAYLRVVTLPSAPNRIFAINGTTFDSAHAVWLELNPNGTLTLFDEDGQVGSASASLTLGQWYRVELHMDASGATGTDVVQARLDGSQFASLTTRNLDTVATAGIAVGANLNLESQTQGEWHFDDVALNDVSGTDQISWPGAGNILVLFVSGNGSTTNRGVQGTDWDTAPTPGLSASGQVDEQPAPDDGTSYIMLMSTSISLTDPPVMWFTVETGTSKGIGPSDTITLAAVRARHCSTSGARQHYPILKSGATEVSGTVCAEDSATWRWDNSTNPYWSNLVRYTDPATGAPWTLTALNAVQCGVRAGNDVTPNPWISMIALDVEYVPAAQPFVGEVLRACVGEPTRGGGTF